MQRSSPPYTDFKTPAVPNTVECWSFTAALAANNAEMWKAIGELQREIGELKELIQTNKRKASDDTHFYQQYYQQQPAHHQHHRHYHGDCKKQRVPVNVLREADSGQDSEQGKNGTHQFK